MAPLVAALLLAAGPGVPVASGSPLDVTGVPVTGAAGLVRRQLASGSGVVLVLDAAEIGISPWPGTLPPARLEGLSLRALTHLHPEGPSYRIELGPEGSAPRWVIGSRVRPPTGTIDGWSLGRPVTREDGDPRVPVLRAGREVALLRTGESTLLRSTKGSWCLRILALAMPGPSEPGISDGPRESRVDFLVQRLRRTADRCG
jgi:hypothetical protein